MSARPSVTDDASNAPYLAILADLSAGTSSPQKAALALSSLCLSHRRELAVSLIRTWTGIIVAARDKPEEQDKLVDLLVSLSLLPDAEDKKGEPILVHGMHVWRDMPMLGWEFNYEWNGFNVPSTSGPERGRIIQRFTNINAFTAHLMSTHHSAFSSFSLFALWTMRSALETPPLHALLHAPQNPPSAFIAAAAAWIDILGPEIYEWDEEFAYGPLIGDGGAGGPLWKGEVHGFCRKRWVLWRTRFGEIAVGAGGVDVDEGVREVAREAEERMGEIEVAAGVVEAGEEV